MCENNILLSEHTSGTSISKNPIFPIAPQRRFFVEEGDKRNILPVVKQTLS